MHRRDQLRQQALDKLQEFEVLMRQGHFDYGNGFHGRVYLNPHQLFRFPSTIWRLAAAPGSLTAVEVWADGNASVAFTNRT